MKIKLEEMMRAIELGDNLGNYYYNKSIEKIIYILDQSRKLEEVYTEEDLDRLKQWEIDDLRAAIDVEENWDNYILLPSKYDMYEYEIKEKFCYYIKDEKISTELIKEGGYSKRFDETVRRLNVENEWQDFREKAIKKRLLSWCSENELEVEENYASL